MRYRQLSSTGDYTFGFSASNFYINTPEAVGQAVETRLNLFTGTWFLDILDGTPWLQDVLGKYTQQTYEFVLRSRILGTPGVTSIESLYATYDPTTRALTITGAVYTAYSTQPVLFGVAN